MYKLLWVLVQSLVCFKEPNLFAFPGIPFTDASKRFFSPFSSYRIVTAMSIREDYFEKQSLHLLSLLNSIKQYFSSLRNLSTYFITTVQQQPGMNSLGNAVEWSSLKQCFFT